MESHFDALTHYLIDDLARLTLEYLKETYVGCLEHPNERGPYPYDQPRHLAIDRQGDLYVAYPKIRRIHKYNPSGNLIADWLLKIHHLLGMTANPTGGVCILDHYRSERSWKMRSRLLFYDSEGRMNGLLKKRVIVPTTCSRISSREDIYVYDGMGKILVISPEGHLLRSIEIEAERASGIAVTSSEIYLIGDYKNRVWVFDRFDGNNRLLSSKRKPLRSWGEDRKEDKKEDEEDWFHLPNGIALDLSEREIFISYYNYRTQVFTPEGRPLRELEYPHRTDDRSSELRHAIAVSSQGTVYITDQDHVHILR